MDFFTGFGFVADVFGCADFMRNKFRRSDADRKEFLSFIKKLVKSVCKDYKNFLEQCPDHGDIYFPNEYEALLYESVCAAVEKNTPLTIEMILSSETNFPKGEKRKLYDLLKARLHYSFEYAIRDGQTETHKQLQILLRHSDDVMPCLTEICASVEEIKDGVSQILSNYSFVQDREYSSVKVKREKTNEHQSPHMKENPTSVFLFVTANEHEREAFENKFICKGEQSIKGKTYYLGMFGRYPAAYIHMDEQGVTSPAATPLVSELVCELNPVAVVMVGIAFGADKDKQKIGDVLVSDKILPYDSQRLLENETEYKDTPKEVGFQLLNAFRDHRKWIYNLPRSEQSKVYIGAMLTGSRLINNYAYRTQLLNDFAVNRPIGGEMEAHGIYSMCRLHGVAEWIIVKGICDWGYEKDTLNKENDQEIAAHAAVDYCFHVFSRDGVFDPLVNEVKGAHFDKSENLSVDTGSKQKTPPYLAIDNEQHIEKPHAPQITMIQTGKGGTQIAKAENVTIINN